VLDEVREGRRRGATMVVLAGRWPSRMTMAWVEESGTARLITAGEPRRTDEDADDDAVELAAGALRALVDTAGATPERLWMIGPTAADRSYFRGLADAAALAELPAPSWVPLPVALVGGRLAARFGAARVGTSGRGGTPWSSTPGAAGSPHGPSRPVPTLRRSSDAALWRSPTASTS